jgi:hypothetical protein
VISLRSFDCKRIEGQLSKPADSGKDMKSVVRTQLDEGRRHFVGGSDARVIMGQDEKRLIRLWQEKRGEVGPEDLSGNLIVQLGLATEDLNRTWHGRNNGGHGGGPSTRPSYTPSFPGFLNSIAEPDARTASILVDELDACFFQNSFDV